MRKPSPVVHFEMPYVNAKRVSKFYEKAFGWDMQYLAEMGKYVLAYSTKIDKKTQRPKEPGAINGGFYPKSTAFGGTHFVISVDNLKKQVEVVKKAGGKVVGKEMDIQGVGLFVMIKDSEGNKVGILQPQLP